MDNNQEIRVLVVGSGNIGGAMACGMSTGGAKVILYNRSAKRLERYLGREDMQCTTDLATAFSLKPDIVLICIEGHAVESWLESAGPLLSSSHAIVASAAASVSISQMEATLKPFISKPKLLRILPNIAAKLGKSVNLLASSGLSTEEISTVKNLLSATGVCIEIEERLFGAAMSLSSCGIAFALRYVRACTEAGVELGLSPWQASDITAAVLSGTAAMLEHKENGRRPHAEELVDSVTTPGGLTIKGLNEMENNGFSKAVLAGIKAAVK